MYCIFIISVLRDASRDHIVAAFQATIINKKVGLTLTWLNKGNADAVHHPVVQIGIALKSIPERRPRCFRPEC